MPDEPGELTFAALEGPTGAPAADSDEFALPAWYRTVRETPLNRLSLEDVARACRQQLFMEHVVPLALAILEREPLGGELYDGELLVSLKSVPRTYWSQHSRERQAIGSVIARMLGSPDLPEDVRQDVEELRSRVNS